MILRIALFLLSFAIMTFTLMAGAYHLGWSLLSRALLILGSETLLAGGGVLLGFWLMTLGKAIFAVQRRYFSSQARLRRLIHYAHLKQEQKRTLQNSRLQQQIYRAEAQRAAILHANNLKQSQQLYTLIQRDLVRITNSVSKETDQQFHAQLSKCFRQRDIEGLLTLQFAIMRHL